QTIGYDGNGNMTSHLDKGVTKIAYNYLDLASSFTLTDASKNSSYIYMADGSKVQTSNNGKITDYLDGFQYESTAGTLTTKILANEEGYFDFINNRYVYQYVDHLGNIRLSYTKNPNGGTTILEENNYYPLGLKHSGYNTGDTTNNKFKYLYNGKELQSSGNLDYGWRQYMPDLGRWFGIDALSESYHMASPYAYVMNNPVSFFDPDGRDVKPTSDGFEFTGSELQGLMSYIRGGNSPRRLISALSAWNEGGKQGDFWGYFGSWNAWGASGADVGGNIYASRWGDGAMGATPYDIQEIVFTKTRMFDIQSISEILRSSEITSRQSGRIEMLSGMWDVLGIVIANKISPENQTQALGLAALAVILTKGKAAPGIINTESKIWKVGAYNELRGLEAGLDAHHVGQSALMKRLVSGYDHKSAPTILVPVAGHRKLIPEIGRMEITRGSGNFTNARQVLARDIFELRRVYGSQGIPNSALQELIEMNKKMYPGAFMK
ncbi:RHS repeat-associated core domain-containing protein, partial [Chryseobacterium sp.]|uniref:RHS repeat domain-containing protein n=1 Tax=Chryseobacterium sp. TaxID=1871047 RepID=UPI00333F7D59